MRQTEYLTIEELLTASLRDEIVPIFYFDTNVILDIIDRRKESSLKLYDFLIQKNWNMVTSVFAKVEIYETKQKDRFRQEKELLGWTGEKIRKNIDKRRDLTNDTLELIAEQIKSNLNDVITNFNRFTHLDKDEDCILAEGIKEKTNLSDKDSIHLAEALAIACNIFLTKDTFLKKVAKDFIFTATPDEILNIIGGKNCY